jgi:hypothetical protein
MNEIWLWRTGGMILKWAAESFGKNPVPVHLCPPPGIEENVLSRGTACFVGKYPCYSGIKVKFLLVTVKAYLGELEERRISCSWGSRPGMTNS